MNACCAQVHMQHSCTLPPPHTLSSITSSPPPPPPHTHTHCAYTHPCQVQSGEGGVLRECCDERAPSLVTDVVAREDELLQCVRVAE